MTLIALAALAMSSGTLPQDAPAQTNPPADTPARLGGLAPGSPWPNGPPAPGQQVVFVPNPKTPNEAFPPPPPRENLPFCKRGQYDGCKQRGG